MQRTKKLLSAALALLMLASVFSAATITASAYSGYTYTSDAALAQKLTKVFNGEAKLFNNTNATYPVGSSINNNFEYGWGDTYPNAGWGYQCFAYAQGVYYYLFDEVAGSADRNYTKSEVVLRSKSTKLYRELLAAGVGCGAYMRTINYDDSDYGHSFILLTYDKDSITFLEGNSDYHGLVAIKTFTWEEFKTWRLDNQNRYLGFVVQPKRTRWTITAPSGTFSISTPKNLRAEPYSTDEVELTWSAVSDADEYYIYMYDSASGQYEYYDTAWTNSYIADWLDSGTTYYFKVRASKSVGGETVLSSLSESAHAAPIVNMPDSLYTPYGLSAYGKGDSVYLNWYGVSDANMYYIYRYNGTKKDYVYIGASKSTSYTASGLHVGTTYYFKVRAVAKYGTQAVYSGLTDAVKATPVMVAPTGLTASPGSGSVKLKWNAAVGATKYYIYRYNGTKKDYVYIGASTGTSFTATGLDPNTSYYFKIRSVRVADGETFYSALSSDAHAMPTILAPTKLRASSGGGCVYLGWNAAPGASYYYVYRYNGEKKDYVYIGSTSSCKFTSTGLYPGTQYYFKVRAVKETNGNRRYSELTADVHAAPGLAAPTSLTAARAKGGVTLRWNAVNGATKYYIYRYNGTQKDYVYIGASQGTSYTASGLYAGTQYYFRVRAVRVAGGSTTYSALSNVANAAPY